MVGSIRMQLARWRACARVRSKTSAPPTSEAAGICVRRHVKKKEESPVCVCVCKLEPADVSLA